MRHKFGMDWLSNGVRSVAVWELLELTRMAVNVASPGAVDDEVVGGLDPSDGLLIGGEGTVSCSTGYLHSGWRKEGCS